MYFVTCPKNGVIGVYHGYVSERYPKSDFFSLAIASSDLSYIDGPNSALYSDTHIVDFRVVGNCLTVQYDRGDDCFRTLMTNPVTRGSMREKGFELLEDTTPGVVAAFGSEVPLYTFKRHSVKDKSQDYYTIECVNLKDFGERTIEVVSLSTIDSAAGAIASFESYFKTLKKRN